jgi:endonuclease/exonuclease/phosphatase family metal-dependent hydrolase
MTALRVMTFNVRQPDGDDGINSWPERRDLLVDTILEQAPDLIGSQELFLLQAEFILARAPQYAWFGRGRFGDDRDKHVGIFYRKDRCRLTLCGDLWLSETPDVPGSSSWDIVRPRQITWGVFELDSVGCVAVLNTHFPYRAAEQEARRRTALLIKECLAGIPDDTPVILTTDANSPADGEVHGLLCEDLRDAWSTAGTRIGPEGTLNGFGRHASSRRLDWILYRAPWRVLEAETVTRNRDGRYPSDHFPVVATFDVA